MKITYLVWRKKLISTVQLSQNFITRFPLELFFSSAVHSPLYKLQIVILEGKQLLKDSWPSIWLWRRSFNHCYLTGKSIIERHLQSSSSEKSQRKWIFLFKTPIFYRMTCFLGKLRFKLPKNPTFGFDVPSWNLLKTVNSLMCKIQVTLQFMSLFENCNLIRIENRCPFGLRDDSP